jgi:hypothetical protein
VTDGGSGPVRFETLPPQSTLPSNSECTARVRRSSWEPRPENTTANQTTPGAQQLQSFHAEAGSFAEYGSAAMTFKSRVDGDFTGTTDEILQWAACKWGLDEDIVRAIAVQETWWRQDGRGDWENDPDLCADDWDGNLPCPTSFGLMQVKWYYSADAWPMFRDSTAFNVDIVLARWRACYEGEIGWIVDFAPDDHPYQAGDQWMCVGIHYAGGTQWYQQSAQGYIDKIQDHVADRTWEQTGF